MLEQGTNRQLSEVESAILRRLEMLGACKFDELSQVLPDYTWNQVFAAVDRLSRDGTVLLQRPARFEYVVEIGMQHVGSSGLNGLNRR